MEYDKFIKEKLTLLPNKPGVYIMRDKTGKVIYVGKAVVLKNRVRSYFRDSGNVSIKVATMVKKIADFEYIITTNELEALILECNLIKKYRPKYNIMLKDDKSYPYLKLTLGEEYPRIFPVRRLVKDGSKYFGPYADVSSMKETLKILKQVFPLRSCRKMNSKRPCLEYHIKRCYAPCANLIDKDTYWKMVDGISVFLEGRSEELVRNIKMHMHEAASEMRYEDAAIARDQLNSLEAVRSHQTAITVMEDTDVIGMSFGKNNVCAQVFFVRSGKIVGRDHYFLNANVNDDESEVLCAFLQQYYSSAAFIPKEIVFSILIDSNEKEVLSKWLTSLKGKNVFLKTPKRGIKKDLIALAQENAQELLNKDYELSIIKEKNNLLAIKELAEILGIKEDIKRIDCYDISHIQGSETVASMVVFRDGKPSKNDYRRFKITSTEGKPDDFQAMKEVVLRRYSKYENLPSLAIIDGGKGQLNVALEVIRGLGLDFPVISLAERLEEVFTEHNAESILLPKNSQALFLMQRIRDEAHRFAITYHRKLREKRGMTSILDNIPRIGEVRKKALLEAFGSVKRVRTASKEELMTVKGLDEKTADSIIRFFKLSNDGFK